MSTAVDAGEAFPFSRDRPVEKRRGELGMWLFIATEAMLFVLLLFGYFYLAASQPHWPLGEDPPYTLALVLLAILVASSVTAQWAKSGIVMGSRARLEVGLGLTLLLSAGFVAIQLLEYRTHLQTLRPGDSSYASIFYTITSFHFLHVIVGMLLLAFVLARALAGHFDEERHVAVKNAVTYWHFVDIVWIFVVVILYLSPHWTAPP